MGDDFSSRWQQLDWDDITLRINGKTARDVERALNADKLTRDDFMALISAAARVWNRWRSARQLTRQRFGNVVSFYVPLYLSNLCANDCTYCGFSMSNRIKRKTLDAAEIYASAKPSRRWGSNTCCWSPASIRPRLAWTISVSTFRQSAATSAR